MRLKKQRKWEPHDIYASPRVKRDLTAFWTTLWAFGFMWCLAIWEGIKYLCANFPLPFQR